MKTGFSVIFYLYLSISVVLGMLFLPVLGWTGTFVDDFNDGKAEEWTIAANAAGEWKVTNGGYNGSIVGGTESIALIGEDDWAVESIEVKVRAARGEWFAVVWRYNDLNNFDSWWLNITTKTLEAWPKVGAYEVAARTSVAVPFDPLRECTLKVVIRGNDFDAYFDGNKVGIYTNDSFKTGKVGFLVWNGSATFDDVVITVPNIKGGLAVATSSSITATLWGKLKNQ